MKQKKIKTYVIIISKKFPLQSEFKGKLTNFKSKILSNKKRHTIRLNYKFWKNRIDEINKGNAILSLRQWSGLPYRSKQIKIKEFKQGEVGYQRVVVLSEAVDVSINTGDGYNFLSDKKIKKLAENDGLTLKQFSDWFKKGCLDGIIIHWTKTRY